MHHDSDGDATLIHMQHGVKMWALAHPKKKMNRTDAHKLVEQQFPMYDVQHMDEWEISVIQAGPGDMMYVVP